MYAGDLEVQMLADLRDCKMVKADLVLQLVMTIPSRSDMIKICSLKKARFLYSFGLSFVVALEPTMKLESNWLPIMVYLSNNS